MRGVMTSSAKSVRSDIISAISRHTRLRDIDDDLQGPAKGSVTKVHFPGTDTLDAGNTDDGIGSLGGSPASERALAASPVKTRGLSDSECDTYSTSPKTSTWEARHPQSQEALSDNLREDVTIDTRSPITKEGGVVLSLAGPENSSWEEDNLSLKSGTGRSLRSESRASVRHEVDHLAPGDITEAHRGRTDRGAAYPSNGRRSQLSVRNEYNSVSTAPIDSAGADESRVSLPEKRKELSEPLINGDGVSLGPDSRDSDSHPQANNIDIELQIFVQNSEETSQLQEAAPGDPAANGGVNVESVSDGEADGTQQPKYFQGSGVVASSVDSIHGNSADANGIPEEQLLTSVLRSQDGRKVRSSSVGHRVRFRGECCIAEAACDDARRNNHTTPKRSRRDKRKIYKSASLSNMAAEAREEEARHEYSTLLKEIRALMAEVRRQRQDFRTEIRSLTTSINRRQNYASKNCVCSTNRRSSHLPVMMSDQEAAKEVKEEVKERKESEETEDKKEKEENSRASTGTSTPEPKAQENGDEAPGTPKALTLREQFRNFCKFGDTKSDGKMITLSQADKWFKQAKVIDGKTITTTDTAITFNKFKAKKITFTDFEKYLDEIAKSKKLEGKDIKTKLKECGAPGTSGTTNVVKSSAVDRLTDTKKFTGSHKLRFDSAGRGKGISGRKDTPDTSGYVAGYKNKNTYDKSH